MIEVVDRVPTYPNRIKITRSNGTSEYVTWERADAPTVEGTPINKALFDSIVEDIGLSGNVTLYVSKAGSDALGNGTDANPYATINKALSVISRNLNGYTAQLNIGAGVYSETVRITGFHGGIVILTGAENASVAMSNLFLDSKSSVEIRNIQLTTSSGYISVVNGAMLRAYSAVMSNGALYGLHVSDGGHAVFYGTLSINNTTGNAINANSGGFAYVYALSGSGNRLGIAAAGGSTVVYDTNSIGASSGFFVASGGRIFSGSQTSIPNY